jgi:hypothetical protein
MVTVVEMSPEDYSGEIAGSYGEACAALGVTSVEGGYGLVLDQDEVAGLPRLHDPPGAVRGQE